MLVILKLVQKILLTLLNPFAPHLTEEIWTNNNYSPAIKDVKWPEYDENKLVKNEIEYAIQINNKIITRLNIPTGISNEEIETIVKNNESIKSAMAGKNYIKSIIIPNRLVNIIAK